LSWRLRLAAFASLFVLVASGLATVDTLSAPPLAAPQPRADTALAPGRVFVLVIDSLRYQTAISEETMPHLAALRARSTYARITPTRDAVTVPCLRAAFTGRDRTRVFGFVENFLKGNAGLESMFTALAQAGRSAAVYSDGAFDQFGERGIERLSNGDATPESDESEDRRDHVDEQNAVLPVAFAEYNTGRRDLVVLHVTYTDHVAHEVGVGAPLYKQRFLAADALVEQLDRELPAGDTLVVMGDHGHDQQGRHAVGLDVPTYALYRGPRFAHGLDLGTLSIRDHRYLMGFGLGLPLPDDYGGERHAAALRASAAGLGSYAALAGPQKVVSPGVPSEHYVGYGLGALLLAGLFALWLRLLAAPVVAGFVGALVVCALGVGFPYVRSFVHEPSYSVLSLLWIALWAAALLTTWRSRRLELGTAVLAIPLFVAVPTVYRYGAPVALGPVWLGWLLCASLVLPRPPLSAAGLACAMLVPFGFAESIGFRFEEWILWPPAALPSGFLLLSLLAKIVIFIPSRALKDVALGLGAAGLVTLAQLGHVPFSLQLPAALVLLALGTLRKHTIASVTGLVLLHRYSVRIPTNAYYWQDCLLAALVLSARYVRELPSDTRTHAHAVLLWLAFFSSGWVSFAWTLHRLEWGFLYEFWSAAFVESHVGAFLPLLMGRFALPLLAARVLLRRELGDNRPALAPGWVLAGSKVASLMFWSYGTAFVSVASDVYLEAVQETSLALVLLLGLL
jgi:hypothetical protein